MMTLLIPKPRPAWLVAALLLSSNAVLAQPAADAPEEVSYRIRDGDTLIGLAQRYLIQPSRYVDVQRRNRIADGRRLVVGSQLIIPTHLLKSVPLSANVIAFKGRVQLGRNGGSRGAAIGMPIAEGYLLETGDDGFLTLRLFNGTRVSLPSRTRVRVARLRQYVLTRANDIEFAIEKGRTETAVTPLKDPKSQFRIRTPIAVSAVRGTVFRIGYEGENDPSLTEVVEGKVAVNPVRGAASELPGGFGAAVAKSGDTTREQLLPAPKIFEPGRDQTGTELLFKLQADPNAKGYHVQIAKDAQFVDIVAALRSTATDLAFGALPDGPYFVRAMAIAPSGLEGLSETFGFRRKINPLSSAPDAAKVGDHIFSWNGLVQAGAQFRLQVFPHDRLDLPYFDESGLKSTSLSVADLKPGQYVWRVATTTGSGASEKTVWTSLEPLTITP